MLSSRSSARILPALLLAAVTVTPGVQAHIPSEGVGTQCSLLVRRQGVRLTFDLSYDGFWAQAEMLEADTDKSSSVDPTEADAYLERQWRLKVRPRLAVQLDGEGLDIVLESARHEGLVGEIYGVPFSLYFELTAAFPRGALDLDSEHTIEIDDTVVKDETRTLPRFFIPYAGHSDEPLVAFKPLLDSKVPALLDPTTSSYRIEGRPFELRFLYTRGEEQKLGALIAESSTQTSTPSQRAATPQGVLGSLERLLTDGVLNLQKHSLGWQVLLVGLALLFGALHALSPGHGKSMVAAYLIGTKGRVRDAALLGFFTTITHTGSVFLFGLTLFLITNAGTQTSDAAWQRRVVVACQLASGILLCALGTTLFVRRLRRGQDAHGHSHGHSHGHGHAHARLHGYWHSHDPGARTAQSAERTGPLDPAASEPGALGAHTHEHAPALGALAKTPSPTTLSVPTGPQAHYHSHEEGFFGGGQPSLWDLVTLGFSGGLVPCPAGLTVILLGLQMPQNLPFALFLLVFFSLGLGSVLVAIGVLLVTGKALAAGRFSEGRLLQDMASLQKVFAPGFLAWIDGAAVRLFRTLPALSGLFIAALGAFFCVATVRTGSLELQALWALLGTAR